MNRRHGRWVLLISYVVLSLYCCSPVAADAWRRPVLPTTVTATALWQHFMAICQIPRVSKHEGAVIAHIRELADKIGLRHRVDRVGNLVVELPATKGCEQRPPTICQVHVDMVADKTPASTHDFARDPIQPEVIDGWVTARQTTLGADNGIGVAALMALMTERNPGPHGPLSLLFTVDEEGDFTGADAVDPRFVSASRLINLDSEENHEVNVGCAGGETCTLSVPLEGQRVTPDWRLWRISIDGLTGGHSGVEIHYGRANALRELQRLLLALGRAVPVRLVSMQGGAIDTTIPRQAVAEIFVPASAETTVRVFVGAQCQILRERFCRTDPGLQVHLAAGPADAAIDGVKAADVPRTLRVLETLLQMPQGVQRWRTDFPEVPQTSANPGVAQTTAAGALQLVAHLQSFSFPEIDALAARLERLAARVGGTTAVSAPYVPWAPNPDSRLLKLVCAQHHRLFGNDPKVKVVHAGLECGSFARTFPGIDMISIGPTIGGAHTPGERVSIAAVDDFWRLLLAVLGAAD